LLVPILLAGCHEIHFHDSVEPFDPPVVAGVDFDAADCGIVTGQVHWQGDVPPSETIQAWLCAEGGPRVTTTNLLIPQVRHSGVCGAVVFLRGVDPRRARPWPHSQVAVIQRDYQIRIEQGDELSQVGFVRRGNSIDMAARDPVFYSLHLSGAAFATLPFPDPDVVRRKQLDRNGIVELSSAAGHYWARAYLFVDDHSYYTRTEADGRFILHDVPEGDYDLVCWLPGWRPISHTRDPESALITRQVFEPAIEVVQPISVQPQKTSAAVVNMSAPPVRR
jgi:hypothetical protein